MFHYKGLVMSANFRDNTSLVAVAYFFSLFSQNKEKKHFKLLMEN
jgi:hypothetical protein